MFKEITYSRGIGYDNYHLVDSDFVIKERMPKQIEKCPPIWTFPLIIMKTYNKKKFKKLRLNKDPNTAVNLALATIWFSKTYGADIKDICAFQESIFNHSRVFHIEQRTLFNTLVPERDTYINKLSLLV